MTRICPFCKSKLGMYDRYFCTSCGNSLPVELTESGSSEKKVIKHEVPSPKPSPINLEKIRGKKIPWEKVANYSVIVFSFLALTLVIYRFLLPNITLINKPKGSIGTRESTDSKKVEEGITGKVSQTQPAPITINAASKNVISPNCSFTQGSLMDQNLAKVVPYEVDLYIEAVDSYFFTKEILDSGIISDEKFTSFIKTYQNDFVGNLGFFVTKNSEKYSYGMVFMLKGEQDKEKMKKDNNVVISGSVIILVTDASAIEEFGEVEKGLEKSLVLNPIYASAKSILPKEGKLFILPITLNGEGFLYQLLDKKLTDGMFSIVNTFLDSKLDYAVVL